MQKRPLIGYWGPRFGVFFLVLFPRAGFLVENLPITIGYLFICAVGLFLLPQSPLKSTTCRIKAFLSLLPFQLLAGFTLFQVGIAHYGFFFSFLLSFFLFPTLAYLPFSQPLEKLDKGSLLPLLRRASVALAWIGMILLAFYHLTGHHWGIPFLTTESLSPNAVLGKHNMRLTFPKLVSTYNNGNIFGLCFLMLFPLTQKRPIQYAALFLTSSRTVWIALLFQECLSYCMIERNPKRLFTVSALLALYILMYSFFIIHNLLFLFDPECGGRLNNSVNFDQINAVNFDQINAVSFDQINHLFAVIPFAGIGEMVYHSIAKNFGWVGLITYLIGIGAPLVLYAGRSEKSRSQTCIAVGLLTYLFASISDGALLYIPVMAFYWLLSSLLLGSPKSFLDGERARAPAASCPPAPSRSPWLMPYRGE